MARIQGAGSKISAPTSDQAPIIQAMNAGGVIPWRCIHRTVRPITRSGRPKLPVVIQNAPVAGSISVSVPSGIHRPPLNQVSAWCGAWKAKLRTMCTAPRTVKIQPAHLIMTTPIDLRNS